MKPIRIVVYGASGKMGREMINYLCSHPEIEIVGAVELEVSEEFYLPLLDECEAIPFSSNLD